MKQSKQNVTQTIDVTPSEAWEVIGAVTGVDKWLGPITACRVEGGKRYCETEAGAFSEDILKIDHENMSLKYGIPIQNMIPVQNIVGHMQVHDNKGKAKVDWTWEFDVEDDKEEEAREMLAMTGQMGIEGIENLIKSTVEVG